MPSELKPCPFCGGEAELVMGYLYGKVRSHTVFCKKCGCEIKEYVSSTGARNAWNRRANNV